MTERGKLLVIEGLDGSGKSTLLPQLVNILKKQGLAVAAVREPGGTQLGEMVRDILKSNLTNDTDELTKVLLLYAARNQLLKERIEPLLSAGTWVIMDRHDLSSHAYQGAGGGMNAQVKILSSMVCKDIKPDLTLFLDVPYSVAMSRLSKRGVSDEYDTMSESLFNRIRKRYLKEVDESPTCVLVNAHRAPEAVLKASVTVLRETFPVSAEPATEAVFNGIDA